MRVVAGVILNDRGQVLLAQRPEGKHLAGLWEFPGGKIEPAESETEALQRELKEELELDVEIGAGAKLGEFPFTYEKSKITLIAFVCRSQNQPQATEHVQNFKWLQPHQIEVGQLAPADIPVLEEFLNWKDRELRRNP